MAEGELTAGTFNENPPHGFGGGGKEMGSVRKGRLTGADQTQPGFMHQRRGLERLSRRFARHLAGRESAQLLIHLIEQVFGSHRVAVFHGV
jgi:hypothetical protein